MRQIYFVTEGVTDQIVLEALIAHWLGDADFLSNRIQPPSSDYAEPFETQLSQGWRGVLAWCSAVSESLRVSRDTVLSKADILVVHVDGDVARDNGFSVPAFSADIPPVEALCDHVRRRIAELFGGDLPANVVVCVPALDLEAWLVAGLHPEVADEHEPIECFDNPAQLLLGRAPHRMIRMKDGRFRKVTERYKDAVDAFLASWAECVARAPQAGVFEAHTRGLLDL
jgi:hypothetical protein